MKKYLRVFIGLIAIFVFSSCSLNKTVSISSTGKQTNVYGGVIHPATHEPVTIDLHSRDKKNKL